MNRMARALKAKRIKLGLRQAEMADIFDVSRVTYTQWESGDIRISLEHAFIASVKLKISLDRLAREAQDEV